MKKLLWIVIMILFICGNANSGWLDIFSKDHKYCGDVARSISKNKNTQEKWYKECRLQMDLFGDFNWKMQLLEDDD